MIGIGNVGRWAAWLAAFGWLLSLVAPAPTLAAVPEGFEGPTPSWRMAGGDAPYRLLGQQRGGQPAHSGRGCEWIGFEAGQGQSLYVTHSLGNPRVVDDLRLSLWLRSDRPGMQLAARVILPHTLDRQTGQPLAVMLVGSRYEQPGRWQELSLEDVPRLLQHQVWTLRTTLGPSVDPSEAYVEQVLLNVYVGPGTTNLWIDDLDVAGYVTTGPTAAGTPARTTPVSFQRDANAGDMAAGNANDAITRLRWTATAGAAAAAAPGAPPAMAGSDAAAVPAGAAGPRPRVQLTLEMLLVDGRPFLPRAIEYRGEPIDFLQRLGFNTLWLDQPPPPALLDEATRLGMWIVCPPPFAPRSDLPNDTAGALSPIGPAYGSVLAWDLGVGLNRDNLETTRRWAEQLRSADSAQHRPILCRADGGLSSFSRYCDVLLLDRRPLGSSLELSDYAEWLQQQPLLARAGTPIWTTVQTQPAAAVRGQLQLIAPGQSPPNAVADEQVRLLAYTAISAGSRGLLALSDSPLTADDVATRYRAATLELLNLELELIEPFVAGGSLTAQVDGSEPETKAAMLRNDRARLLLPLWAARGAQWAPAQSAANNLRLVVPGVPEPFKAFELLPGRADPLRDLRVTGGKQITLNEFGVSSLVLLTGDPLIIGAVSQRATGMGPRAAALQRALVHEKARVANDVLARLAGRQPPPRESSAWLTAAERALTASDSRFAARDYAAAYVEAARAARALRLVERAAWETATARLPSPVSSPAAVSFQSLPWQVGLDQRMAASTWGPPLLAGGEMEDLAAMTAGGWRHFKHPSPSVRSDAELSPLAAHSGRSGVRLLAEAVDPHAAPAVIEQPPVWITTAPTPVESGQLVCLRGWINVPQPITGSVDGVLVLDSLGGEPLALRVGKTADGWREFALYRVASQSGWFTATFALTGLGEAWIDDVSVQVLYPQPSLTPPPYNYGAAAAR